jgi:hypothetical protein
LFFIWFFLLLFLLFFLLKICLKILKNVKADNIINLLFFKCIYLILIEFRIWKLSIIFNNTYGCILPPSFCMKIFSFHFMKSWPIFCFLIQLIELLFFQLFIVIINVLSLYAIELIFKRFIRGVKTNFIQSKFFFILILILNINLFILWFLILILLRLIYKLHIFFLFLLIRIQFIIFLLSDLIYYFTIFYQYWKNRSKLFVLFVPI